MCQWLFEVGAAADITKADNEGGTPMCIACGEGHPSICKWLFEVGAAADIAKQTAWRHSHVGLPGGPAVGVPVAVVRVGAGEPNNDDDVVHEDYFGDGHVDQNTKAYDNRDIVQKGPPGVSASEQLPSTTTAMHVLDGHDKPS